MLGGLRRGARAVLHRGGAPCHQVVRTRTTLSGIQPTGVPTLGNYLGAVRQWVAMQRDPSQDRIFLMIADLHAMTVPFQPDALRARCMDMAAALLALGLDPARIALFRQSGVPQHAELAWILGCVASMGQLQRMTQFKEKAATQQAGAASVGLFTYPVLQAADILLYQATDVPVGDDQRQHVELTRDIAQRVNAQFGPIFTVPEPNFQQGAVRRIMSLRDGTKKMSKSDPVPASRIELTDSADDIREKLRRAKTDTIPDITYDPESRPDVSNLVSIFAAITDTTHEQVVAQCAGVKTGQFKQQLADALVEHIVPLGDRFRQLQQDPAYLSEVLDRGRDTAAQQAEATMRAVRQALGLSHR